MTREERISIEQQHTFEWDSTDPNTFNVTVEKTDQNTSCLVFNRGQIIDLIEVLRRGLRVTDATLRRLRQAKPGAEGQRKTKVAKSKRRPNTARKKDEGNAK